jgi:hypothetical protein
LEEVMNNIKMNREKSNINRKHYIFVGGEVNLKNGTKQKMVGNNR